jgi:hypothetical protein
MSKADILFFKVFAFATLVWSLFFSWLGILGIVKLSKDSPISLVLSVLICVCAVVLLIGFGVLVYAIGLMQSKEQDEPAS